MVSILIAFGALVVALVGGAAVEPHAQAPEHVFVHTQWPDHAV